MQHPWRAIILIWLIVLTIVISGIGGWYYNSMRITADRLVPPTPTTVPTSNTDLSDQLSQLSARIDALESASTSSGKTKTVVVNNNTTTTVPAPATAGKVREAFLPVGGGNTDNRDWMNLTGAQIMFDPRKYGQIVSVRFEASGSIIGGEVHARLIDIKNNVIYYNTEVMMNTNSPTWKRSSSFGVPNAPVTYQVQILSTSGETAYLQDSRLVIESKY